MGYVAFAADIYGSDLQQNLTMEQRIEQASKYRGDPELFVQRMQRALEEVKTYNEVDTNNIAVIGYCFGGTGVIQLAFSGNDEVKIVVSFHGGLTDLPFPQVEVKPYTLILSGGADDAHGNQTELEAALNGGNATWETTRYAGVEHGFTVWGGDGYSLVADYRSWSSMKLALAEKMPVPTKSGSEEVMDTTTSAGANAFAAVWPVGVIATLAAVVVLL